METASPDHECFLLIKLLGLHYKSIYFTFSYITHYYKELIISRTPQCFLGRRIIRIVNTHLYTAGVRVKIYKNINKSMPLPMRICQKLYFTIVWNN